jgi:hypothetical protein
MASATAVASSGGSSTKTPIGPIIGGGEQLYEHQFVVSHELNGIFYSRGRRRWVGSRWRDHLHNRSLDQAEQQQQRKSYLRFGFQVLTGYVYRMSLRRASPICQTSTRAPVTILPRIRTRTWLATDPPAMCRHVSLLLVWSVNILIMWWIVPQVGYTNNPEPMNPNYAAPPQQQPTERT